jgi:hypothetical protein
LRGDPKRIPPNARQHPLKHQLMKRPHGVPIEQTKQTMRPEQGCLAHDAWAVVANLYAELEHPFAGQSHFGS